MIRPCTESSCGCGCGGLAAADEKKTEEDKDGKEEIESGESGGDGRALERGDEGWDDESMVVSIEVGGMGSGREDIGLGEHVCASAGGTGRARTVPALVLIEISIIR